MSNMKKWAILFPIFCIFLLALCTSTKSVNYTADEMCEAWNAQIQYVYPFAEDTSVNSLAADGGHLLVTANGQSGPEAALFNIESSDELCSICADAYISLNEHGNKDYRLYASAVSDNIIYLLIGAANAEEAENNNYAGRYVIKHYDTNGNFIKQYDINYESSYMPYGLIISNEVLFIWNLREISEVSLTDGSTNIIFKTAEDMWPVSVDGKNIYAQINTTEGSCYTLKFDFTNGSCHYDRVTGLDGLCNLSITNTNDEGLLINDGKYISNYSEGENSTSAVDVYEALGDYTNQYKRICQIGDKAFVFSKSRSNELLVINFEYSADTRTPLSVAGFSESIQGKAFILDCIRLFNQSQTQYRASLTEFSTSQTNLNKLILLCNSQEAPDLLLCDGQIHSDNVFEDLTTYIESGQIYEKNDCPSDIISQLKSDGRVYEVWGGYSIFTLAAYSEELSKTDALSLELCKELYADDGRYDSLFDNIYSDTMTDREAFFSFFAPHIIDPASGKIDRTLLMSVLDSVPDLQANNSEKDVKLNPMLRFEIINTVDRLKGISEFSDGNFWFFDGANGGCNFSKVVCAPGACMMIPSTSNNKPAACSFIKLCIAAESQMKLAEKNNYLCSSAAARRLYLSKNAYAEDLQKLEYLIENARIYTEELQQEAMLLTDQLKPYLGGSRELEVCIQNAESRLQIYENEHT